MRLIQGKDNSTRWAFLLGAGRSVVRAVNNVSRDLQAVGWVTAPIRNAVRYRYLIVGLLAAGRGFADGSNQVELHDADLFLQAGRAIVGGRWEDAYSSGDVQEGPFTLFLFGLADRLSTDPLLIISMTIQAAVVLCAMNVTRVLGDHTDRGSGGMELCVGLFVLGIGTGEAVATTGHFGDALIPLLWVWAAVRIQAGRLLGPSLLLIVAGLLKPWGLLGAALWALGPTARRSGIGALPQLFVTAAICIPFFALGQSRALKNVWAIETGSFWALIGLTGTFDWSLRIIQGAMVFVAGVFVAFMLRRRRIGPWAVPSLILGLKLLLDPSLLYYYWSGPSLLSALGAVLSSSPMDPLVLRLLVGMIVYIAVFPFFLLEWRPLAIWMVVAYAVLAVGYDRTHGRGGRAGFSLAGLQS